MTKTKNKGLLPSAFWLFITVLSATMLIRGIWAMTQPWGNLYQQMFGWFFFFVCFIFSLYNFLASRATSASVLSGDKMKHFVASIMSATFVLGGVLVLVIGKSGDRLWALLGILLFGACAVYYFRNYRKINYSG